MMRPHASLEERIDSAVAFINEHQRDDGAIEASPGRLDVWNHVESAMALDVGGQHALARRAYDWIAEVQHEDGGVWAEYQLGAPRDLTRDVNHATYLAVGAWHHTLLRDDRDWLRGLWPTIERAMEFALGLQAEDGSIHWARDAEGTPWPDSLVAGASSVRASLLSAERIAGLLDERATAERWRASRLALEVAFERFEDRWGSQLFAPTERYAMHWYYPVLCGLVSDEEARTRLDAGTERFVQPFAGCRCVDDQPWVTIAESSELAIALDAAGRRAAARELLDWQLAWQDADGGFRMGTVVDYGAWPEERPSWTAAAVVLAADALYDLTPAAGLFRSLHDPPREG
jgi:hypothetical protein